jgi:hypothetical protein
VIPIGDDQCRFSYADLEDALKHVIKERLGDEEFGMSTSTDKPACRTFCLAQPLQAPFNPPELFRSYGTGENGPSASTCALWEAARATSAAPVYFKEIAIGLPPIAYSDGGLCPAPLARQEADLIWPNSICTFVSIGTGHTPAHKSDDVVRKSDAENDLEVQETILKRITPFIPGFVDGRPVMTKTYTPAGAKAVAMMTIAMLRAELSSQSLKHFLEATGKRLQFYRFNVERVFGDIGLMDWTKQDGAAAVIVDYLRSPDNVIRKMRCVAGLVGENTLSRKMP